MSNIQEKINYQIIKKDFLIVNIAAGGVLLVLFICLLLQQYGILPRYDCLMHELFHIYCPGCGGTRAIMALLAGDVLKSLVCNPAVVVGLILVLYYEVGVIVTLIRRNGKYYFLRKLWLIYGYLGMIIVYGVVRDYLLVSGICDLLGDFF